MWITFGSQTELGSGSSGWEVDNEQADDEVRPRRECHESGDRQAIVRHLRRAHS
jgi:hypothetical protein